jgi:hypothetical protein
MPSTNSTSSGDTTSYISSHDSNLLGSNNLPPGGEVSFGDSHSYNGSAPILDTSLPPLPISFPRGELCLPSTTGYNSVHQLQDFNFTGHPGRSDEVAVLPGPPIPTQDVSLSPNVDTAKPVRNYGLHRRQRRTSRAERMITDVEDLYHFGISLSLLPEDPLLLDALKKMKGRFRALVKLRDPCSQRSATDDTSDPSCLQSDSSE